MIIIKCNNKKQFISLLKEIHDIEIEDCQNDINCIRIGKVNDFEFKYHTEEYFRKKGYNIYKLTQLK